MIKRSQDIDLGRDRTRMKDPADARRQSATVEEILRRFFDDDYDRRRPVQVLADEVGMGKTFVALATAFSMLQSMRSGETDSDLRGCYQRVLIVTPRNEALYTKWRNETGEFVKRCVTQGQEGAARWFAPKGVRRIDELSEELRRPGAAPRVLVTTMSMFQGTKIQHYDLKRRFLLGLLFRYWGPKFQYWRRANLLKGAPAGWPANPDHLTDLEERDHERLPFSEDEMLKALEWIDRQGQRKSGAADVPSVGALFDQCRAISESYVRDRANWFRDVEHRLADLYKSITARLILQDFPLVIVDEAHNWKNGPSQGANGFRSFAEFIAPHARRALLLTATPFQLRPEEMIEILKISDFLRPAPQIGVSDAIRKRVSDDRTDVILPTLKSSETSSKLFGRAWSKLPSRVTPSLLSDTWTSVPLAKARRILQMAAKREGKIKTGLLLSIVEKAERHIEPELRLFFREALKLYAHNEDLSHELSRYVIRHRRRTEHRAFRVGEEFLGDVASVVSRPDGHILHAAPGIDVRGAGELPHYLLMRCVSETKRMQGRKGRSSLGSALTGCYSTLHASAEGRAVQGLLKAAPGARGYLDLLMTMVGNGQDALHPKVEPMVEYALANWRRGEKTLIFCFRVNTADRLQSIIKERIERELTERAGRCLGGSDKLRSLKGRLQAKDRDLIVVGLDRVLWSLVWHSAERSRRRPLDPADLDLTDRDLEQLARLSLDYDVPLTDERVDRVFLTRATEHIIARRLSRRWCDEAEKTILEAIADTAWVESPYGLADVREDSPESEGREFDDRGVHSRYKVQRKASESDVQRTAERLAERRSRAGRSAIFDTYAHGPNLFLGVDPMKVLSEQREGNGEKAAVAEIQRKLWALTLSAQGETCWESRRKTMQALRRAVLRESVLVRLLPDRSELEEGQWGALLVSAFLMPMESQSESMAGKIGVFLEDLEAAGGNLAAVNPDDGGSRYAIHDSTRITDQFVALVKGGGGGNNNEHRTRIFTGFNTPLLPEVLICTQVGQEGIDLHRHCRHVVHYDLAWNPAVLEQRTGRVDRIGSKTFREREVCKTDVKPRLEVGVPFLAGTYDERMFEELRLRAQTFEILTGGDFAADNPEGADESSDAEGTESGTKLIPLPIEMLGELRVRLAVWQGSA